MQNAKTQKGLPVDGVTIAITIVALAMVIYHMTSAQYIIQSAELFLNTHIGMALILVFLGKAQYARGIKRHLTLLAVLLSVAATGYVQIFYTELTDRVWFNTPLDLFVGVILILLVLEATRESFGLVLPVMILIIVIFPFFGQYFPEPFNCTALSISKTISNLSIGLSGIYGTVLSVSANYIFLFILFGSVLQGAGATRLFTQIGGLVGGKLRGGAGLTAVVSSALLGSVTGSVAANIAITGSFTIPLMKKMGYSPEEAGAIEAAASNGGQIMPPIMGISAFAMAAITGIPYINIVVMAIIPALLYFISVGAYVQLRAMKRQLTPTREEVDVRELLLSLPVFLFPFGVIIGLLVMDFSVAYVAFWSIISTLAVSLARKKGRSSLREIMEGFIQGAKEGAKIAVMCGAIGLFLETFITSGLGIKLAAGIETWSGGHLFPALVIIGMICVLMGMGGPAMTAYILVSIFAAPALTRMGIGLAQAHFFAMFLSVFSFVTPPVAVGALIACSISNSSYFKTAMEAVKASFAAFLLPFMFIYVPITLLQPQETFSAIAGITACIAVLFSFQFFFVGFVFTRCSWLERLLWFTSALLFFLYILTQRFTLFAIGMSLFIFLFFGQWKNRKSD